MHTACVWSVKLPFAEYSVVKERRDDPWSRAVVIATPYFTSCDKLFKFHRAGGLRGPRRGSGASIAPLTVAEPGVSGVPGEAAARQSRRLKESGEYRARTGDLLVANQALSQL